MLRYPFHLSEKLDDLRIYIPLISHQYICACIIGLLVNGINLFLIAVLILHKSQIKLLGYRLKQFGHLKSGTSLETMDDYTNLTSLLKMHSEIKE